jgi:hypothetical protein
MEEDVEKERILSKLDYVIHDIRELKWAASHNIVNNKDWNYVINEVKEIERDVKEY